MKTHAKEYLIEFANSSNCSDWLKYIIYKVSNTNSHITENDISVLLDHLKDNIKINIPDLVTTNSTSEDEVKLISLIHKSGVNALANNQKINFHDDVTILNGLNGSGKSSYFRILNEIVGGNEKKEILPNIYSDTKKDVSVLFSYKIGKKIVNDKEWNNTTRGFKDLTKCRVFDSSYLNGFLDVRHVDETLVFPLGLNLFSYIAQDIDRLKKVIKEYANYANSKKPQIDYSNLNEIIKSSFITNNYVSPNLKTEIENKYDFPQEQDELLNRVCNKINELTQNNIQDTINLKNEILNNYYTFNNIFYNLTENLRKKTNTVNTLILEYLDKKKKNEDAKNTYEIFKTLPQNESDEWKRFIQYGEKYRSINKIENYCPYCHQQLDDNARVLLKAYGEYLQDKTEIELQNIETSIKNEIYSIQIINTNIQINESIKNLLTKHKVYDNSALEYTKDCLNKIEDQKKILLSCLGKKEIPTDLLKTLDINPIITIFNNEITSYSNEIQDLSIQDSEKSEKLKKLNEKKIQLLENKSISEQKELFIEWFLQDDNEKKLYAIIDSLSTKEITYLSDKAHNELLTETLKIKFEEELAALGKKNIQVNLQKANASKGALSTKLTLVNNQSLKKILSEGEQKAVALALFLAEIKSQNSNNPIILDDPVTSMDHQIAAKFAERLLQLENQVILFNHNRLFLDAFETTKQGHICKDNNSCCDKRGKHIRVYMVKDEGQNSKGVISPYKGRSAEQLLKDTKILFNKSPFSEESKAAANIRKCVEYTIDEIIFNRQIPTKYSTKNSRINWDELKKINPDIGIIDQLHEIHDRVSGGELHNGDEAEENPITLEELRDFVNKLENILSASHC